MTVGQLLNELEKPENTDQIKYLANFKNLEHMENVKELGGLGGFIAKFAMRFTKKHIDALIALSECENAIDIAEFKKTAHYEKIKNSSVGAAGSLEQLKQLDELKNLEGRL